MIRAHVFTKLDERLFLKQVPGFSDTHDGVTFTFGLDIPDDIDVLIVFARASFSIPTRLPKARTIFFAGEPDVVHPYSAQFLNQFGLVHTTSEKALTTDKMQANYCAIPFVGVRFGATIEAANITDVAAWTCPEDKSDQISIVTSAKTGTPFHRERLAFIEVIRQRIPDRLEIYGRGIRPIDDKADALMPHKYHLSLENGGGRFTWTEKLSDPLLAWSFPFYFGCENAHEDLPGDAFQYIDIRNPDAAIDQMIAAITENRWAARRDAIARARDLIVTRFNLMTRFAEIARRQAAIPLPDGPARRRLIRSERSFVPTEPGQRGSRAEAYLRQTLLMIDPGIELRLSHVLKRREERRARRKAARQGAS